MEKAALDVLKAKAKEIRKLTIEEIGNLGSGHIGGAMSIADILPCTCGRIPLVVRRRPDGRTSDLHQVACFCGLASPRWSVSEASAIRLWNSIMTTGEVPPDEEENASREAD